MRLSDSTEHKGTTERFIDFINVVLNAIFDMLKLFGTMVLLRMNLSSRSDITIGEMVSASKS